MPGTSDESELVLFRCKDCGDEFQGKRHGNHTGYNCFACGGQITRAAEAGDNNAQ